MVHKIIEKFFVSFLLLFSLFGCVHSYYNKNPKLIETNTVDSWKELKVEVLAVNEDEAVFHLWTEDFEKVRDSLDFEVFYNSLAVGAKKYEDVRKELIMMGASGPFLGATFIALGNEMSGCVNEFPREFGLEGDNSANFLYIMGGCSFLVGAVALFQGISIEEKEPKKMTITRIQQKENSIRSLSIESVAVSLSNTKFRKEYITDKEGKVSISIEDISPFLSDELSSITFVFL